MSTSNYVFFQYSKPVLVGIGVTLTILPIIVVGLRFYARRFTRAAVGIDDWCIVVALVLCTAGRIVETIAAEIGGMGQQQRLGPHGELIHTPELMDYEKCRYINEVITTLNLGVIKISILLFYRSLFIVKPFMIASGGMMALVASWAVAFTSAMAAQCSPPSYFWEAFEIDYAPYCIQVQLMYQGLAYSDLILDVLVLSLPIPMVASLHLRWKTKIKVIDVLMLGSVVLGFGIARVVSFMQVVRFTNQNPEAYFKDTLWYTAGPLFWIFAENAIAIIGACLPTLAPLWSRKQPLASKSPYQNANAGEDASVRHLVALGPATNILADDIAFDDRPQEGIQVQTTLSTNYTK